MRIVVNGQRAFGRAVLEMLFGRDANVVGVVCPGDSEETDDELAVRAAREDVPVMPIDAYTDKTLECRLRDLRTDLVIMAFVTKYIPENVLTAATHGTIQYHPSLLPKHRGPSAVNWTILHDDRTAGITIFWPDRGLDTGPILLQKSIDVPTDATVGSLYFDHLFPLGVDAIGESVDMIASGQAARLPQQESLATYEPAYAKTDARIDWSQPSEDVWRRIRASDPRPGAWTTLEEVVVELFSASVCGGQATSSDPGRIVAITEEGMIVAAGDGSVLVQTVRVGGGRKSRVSDVTTEARLLAGAWFR